MGWLDAHLETAVQQRVKVVLWILAHGRILTNSMRYRMGLVSSDCWRCSGSSKDAIHVIRECTRSREVWVCLQSAGLVVGFYSLELKEWVLRKLCCRGRFILGAELPELMAIACWNIWKWRNHEQFRRDRLPLQQRMEDLQHLVEESGAAWTSPVEMELGSAPLISDDCIN